MVVHWRICSLGEFVLHSVKHLVPGRWRVEVAAGRAEEPSTDEWTRTRGCRQDPAANEDKVQRVPRWCVRCHTFNSPLRGPLRSLHATTAHIGRPAAAGACGSREGSEQLVQILITHTHTHTHTHAHTHASSVQVRSSVSMMNRLLEREKKISQLKSENTMSHKSASDGILLPLKQIQNPKPKTHFLNPFSRGG